MAYCILVDTPEEIERDPDTGEVISSEYSTHFHQFNNVTGRAIVEAATSYLNYVERGAIASNLDEGEEIDDKELEHYWVSNCDQCPLDCPGRSAKEKGAA
jgi:hypothetical protein